MAKQKVVISRKPKDNITREALRHMEKFLQELEERVTKLEEGGL
tara:strand:- start:265 stop:396 length:132 start_codon:yes stop_codon:yes gene_type:complete